MASTRSPSIQLNDQSFSITAVSYGQLTVTAKTNSSVSNIYVGMTGTVYCSSATPTSQEVIVTNVTSPGVIQLQLTTHGGLNIPGVPFDFANYNTGVLYLPAQLAWIDSIYPVATTSKNGLMTSKQATELLPPVANNFDPTTTNYSTLATGYIPIVGSRLVTLDGTKAWDKYGTGDLEWNPAGVGTSGGGATVIESTGTPDDAMGTDNDLLFAQNSSGVTVDAYKKAGTWGSKLFSLLIASASAVAKTLGLDQLNTGLLKVTTDSGALTTATADDFPTPIAATYALGAGARTVTLNCVKSLHLITGNASGTAINLAITGATNNQIITVVLTQGAVASTVSAWLTGSTIAWLTSDGNPPTLPVATKSLLFYLMRTDTNKYIGVLGSSSGGIISSDLTTLLNTRAAWYVAGTGSTAIDFTNGIHQAVIGVAGVNTISAFANVAEGNTYQIALYQPLTGLPATWSFTPPSGVTLGIIVGSPTPNNGKFNILTAMYIADHPVLAVPYLTLQFSPEY